jgi:predicted DNA-binding protein (UPF0251 family)
MLNICNVEYIEDEENKDNEENNVYINEEMDDEIEASAFQKEEDLESEDTAAASCISNHTFSSASGMQWRPKTSVDMKKKACNMFPLNQVYKIMQKNILSVAEAFQLFISKKMVEEICTESHKKVKAVFSSSGDR